METSTISLMEEGGVKGRRRLPFAPSALLL